MLQILYRPRGCQFAEQAGDDIVTGSLAAAADEGSASGRAHPAPAPAPAPALAPSPARGGATAAALTGSDETADSEVTFDVTIPLRCSLSESCLS